MEIITNTHKSVSVIIPCYNAQRWIRETLESVVAQDIASLDVIVVDDGSTDDSARVIQSEFPFVRLIQTENRGPSHARNLGTAAASGQYIQYLDADDLLCPGKIAVQVAALERTGADIAYGDWQDLSRDASGNFIPGNPIRRQMTDDPEIALVAGFFCPIHGYLFRREMVEKVGGWNQNVPIIQDVRLVQDCALQGAEFVYCPGLMAQYRKHGTHTISTHNPIAFSYDCLKNATDAEAWWQAHGGLSEKRREALFSAYGYVARSSFGKDPATFEAAYSALKRLSPRGKYIPKAPKSLRLASRFLGYAYAERLAAIYRSAKKRLRLLESVT